MDIGLAAVMTPIGATPGHSTDLPDIVSHTTEAQVHTATTMTHHTADLHPIEFFPKMTADIDHTNPKNNITNQHKDLHQAHMQHHGIVKSKDRRHKQVTIDDPPSEYYSSDDQDSDSEDDLNLMGPLLLHKPREGYPVTTPSPSPISLTALQSLYMQESATKH